MLKKRVRKLELPKETLLHLTYTNLKEAAAGVTAPVCTKPILCTSKCPTNTAVAPGGECCA